MALSLSASAADAEAAAFAALLNDGYLRLYAGTPPQSADAPLGNNPLLAELRFDSPAFQPPENGVLTATTITADERARNTGTATFYRCVTPDGIVVCQGSVGLAGSGAELEFATTTIQEGAVVAVSAFVHTVTS